MLGAFQ
jgi:hypothetical protein